MNLELNHDLLVIRQPFKRLGTSTAQSNDLSFNFHNEPKKVKKIPGNILEPGEDMTFKMILSSGDVHALPHARVVSNVVHDGNDTKAAAATLLLMQVTQTRRRLFNLNRLMVPWHLSPLWGHFLTS